jgi:PAS domain S-box-containing protein
MMYARVEDLKRGYQLQRTSGVIAVGTLLLALAALIGWFFGLSFLNSPLIPAQPINPLSAINIALLSAGLLVYLFKEKSLHLINGIAFLVIADASYILLSHFFHFPFRIDFFFFSESLKSHPNGTGGMAPFAAVNFILLSLSLRMIAKDHRHTPLREYLSFVSLLIAFVPLVLYLYRVPETTPYFLMAPLTAFCFLALSIASLFSRSDRGFIRVLSSKMPGGFTARYLVSAAILFPIILGYVRLQGEWNHWISTEMGVSIIILFFSTVFGTMVGIVAGIINRKAQEQLEKEKRIQVMAEEQRTLNEELVVTTEELQSSNEELQSTIEALELANQTIAQQKDEQLKTYRENLEIIFNNSSDNFILIDRNARIVLFNKGFQRFTESTSGITPAKGDQYFDVLPADRVVPNRTAIYQAFKGESVSAIGQTGQGNQARYFNVRYTPVFTDGEVSHVTISAFDVTNEVKQEKALEEYRQNLNIIFENTRDMFMLVNTDAQIILMNKPFEKHLDQMSYQKVTIGSSLYDIVEPKNRAGLQDLIEQVKQGKAMHSFSETPLEGKMMYFDVFYSPVIKDGQVTHISITANDVSERTEQEKALEEYRHNLDTVFKTSKDTFLLIDKNEKVVLFNQAFDQALQAASGFEAKAGMDFIEVVSPARREKARSILKRAFAGESIATEAEVTLINGTKQIHYVRYEPVRKNGNITHVCFSGVDITDFKKFENELKQKQDFLDKASESAKIGYWTCEPDLVNGKVTWSKELFSIFEIDEKEFTGCANMFNRFVHPDDQAAIDEASKKTFEEGALYNVEHRIILKNGKVKWINDNATMVRDEAGKPKLLVGVTQDITDRKAIEMELKQDQYFLEKASESAKIGYWTSELNNGVSKLTWSKEVFSIFQVSPEEFDGTNQTFFNRVHPDDREHVQILARHAFEQGTLYEVDHRILLPNGTVRWVNERAQVLQMENQKTKLMVGIVQDINDRKIIEEVLREYNDRFEILSKATNDAIWDWDVDANTVVWNHGIESIFGYSERETKNAMSWWEEKVHPTDRDRVALEIEEVFASKSKNWISEYSYRCADGSYKYVLDRAYIIYKNNEPLRMIGAMQDITEVTEYRLSLEKKVEDRTKELNQALRKEKEAVETQKRFVSMASHEFRTPLSTILLSSGYMKKFFNKMSKADVEQKILTIEKQVNHMTVLLEDVLTVGKGEAGKIQVSLREINVEHFLKTVSQEVIGNRGKGYRIDMKLNLGQKLFNTDEGLMRNIVINLLTNAIKFSPDSKSIELTASLEKAGLHLAVKDFGMGISPEDQKRLFEPFYRGTNIQTISGTGLGLSIVKKAVDLLKGEIEVNSVPGTGTEFIVTLPQPEQ